MPMAVLLEEHRRVKPGFCGRAKPEEFEAKDNGSDLYQVIWPKSVNEVLNLWMINVELV
jgi:hypothetical protein